MGKILMPVSRLVNSVTPPLPYVGKKVFIIVPKLPHDSIKKSLKNGQNQRILLNFLFSKSNFI